MTFVSSIKASLEQGHDHSPPVTRAPLERPSWYPELNEHANLSPIVKNGSLRRQHGHVRLAALRQLARNGAIRVPPPDAGRRQSSLPREVLDRSLPPVPPAAEGAGRAFAVKRKSVPDARDPPPSPEMPSWVKQPPLNSPRPVVTSAPSTPQGPVTPSRPQPSPAKASGTRPLSIIRRSQRETTADLPPSPPVQAVPEVALDGMPGRSRLIPGARVKEAVEKIENITSTPNQSPLSTPVRAIGAIVEKPCPVSSAGLSSEARRIMAEARLRRIARKH